MPPQVGLTADGRAIHTVVVDLGGVVFLPLDEADLSRRRGLLDARSFWESDDVEAANRGHLSAEAYADRAAHRLGLPAAGVLETIEALYAGTLNQPLVTFLRDLPSPIRVAALTNNWSFLPRLLAHHEIADLFDLVVNSADVGCCKPEPEIFAILLARLGDRPDEVLFIDDDPRNVQAAASLGMHAHLFTGTEAFQRLLLPSPHSAAASDSGSDTARG